MIRNIRGMILATWEMSDRVQAGRVHKFAKSLFANLYDGERSDLVFEYR